MPKPSRSVWIPRAVRRLEQHQGSGPGPHAHAPAPERVDTCGEGDLDAIDDERPAKRPRQVQEEAAAPGADAPAEEAEAGPTAEDQVIAGSSRLATHIRSAGKCIKVAAMAYALLESGAVTERSSEPFFEVLAAAMLDWKRPVEDAKYRVAYRRLLGAAHERRSVFPAPLQPRLEAHYWQLTTCLSLVEADDSFTFMRAMRPLTMRLECLRPDAMPPGKDASAFDGVEAAALWTPPVMAALASAMRRIKLTWAKPTIDAAIRLAMGCRRQFDAGSARQIEDWHQECKGLSAQHQGQSSRYLTQFDEDSARWRMAAVSTAKEKDATGDRYNADINLM